MLPILRKAIETVPDIKQYLTDKARWLAYEPAEYKTYDYFLQQLNGLISGVYNNNLGGDFIDIMANLISGQLTQAYQQAYEDAGYTSFFLPEYLQTSLTNIIAGQYMYVDQLFRDIVDARIDGTTLSPLLARAQLWANQWNTAYREAERLINLDGGGNFMWVKGQTEKGCSTCANLDGIVMSAKEWEQLGVHPRGYPNNKLECQGGGPANYCDCDLVPTEKRRSPDAYGRVEEIIL